MKTIVKYLAIFTALMLTNCKTANLNKIRNQLDKKEQWRYQMPQFGDLAAKPNFPKIKSTKLANGLQIFVVEDHKLPIAQISINFKLGSANDPANKAGLNYLTVNMLKEGTKDKSSLELAEEFANLGTDMSVGINKDMSYIQCDIMSDKTPEIFKLISSVLINPRFAQEDFSRIKAKTLDAITANEGMQSYVAQANFLRLAYDRHPYAHPTMGLKKNVEKISLADVKIAHKNNFAANNAAIIAVGDVTLSQIVTEANKYFSLLKPKTFKQQNITYPKNHQRMQTKIVNRENSPQTYMIVGQPAVTHKDKDLAVIEVLNSILAGLPTSRLGSKLREEKGWTYGVHSYTNPLQHKGPIMISTSIKTSHAVEGLSEILKEINKMKTSEVSREELLTAKSGLINSFISRYATLGNISNIITQKFIYSLRDRYDEDYFNAIKNVSAADILRVANKIFDKKNMTAIMVGAVDNIKLDSKVDIGNVIIDN